MIKRGGSPGSNDSRCNLSARKQSCNPCLQRKNQLNRALPRRLHGKIEGYVWVNCQGVKKRG